MRTSPPPRQRREAAALPPLVIPGDTPDYARRVLASLDRAITCEAATMRDEPLSSNLASHEARGRRSGAAIANRAVRPTLPSQDARLLVAGRMHAHADG